MATLPAMAATDLTLDTLREVSERIGNAEPPRTYLGMSAIGHPCERWLWYSFRWAAREQFDCDTLWRFDDGHRSEDVMATRLRLVPGIHLRTVDASTGQQFGAVDLGGHFRGHADGLITGLLQAPKALHVWEAKAVNEKKAAQLDKLKAEVGEKAALAKWDPVYHAQAILYMAYFEAPRHYLTASTPGVRSMTSVRTNSDLDEARRLRAKAERVITATEPPPRMSEDPAWYQCRWCPAHAICQQRNAMPAVNCRTCAHATPEMDGNGRWSCALHKRDLAPAEQRVGCDGHRFIPALVTYAEPVDADPAANWIEYRTADGRTFRNGDPTHHGPEALTSEELATGYHVAELAADPLVASLRLGGARISAAGPRIDWKEEEPA